MQGFDEMDEDGFAVRPMANDRHRAAFAGQPVHITALALVCDDGVGCLVESGINQLRDEQTVGRFATGQFERNRQTVMVCIKMEFCAEPAARTAERLAHLPLFCNRRRDMRMDHGTIEHQHQVCRAIQLSQRGEVIMEHTCLAEPVEPLPDQVPVTEPFWQPAT